MFKQSLLLPILSARIEFCLKSKMLTVKIGLDPLQLIDVDGFLNINWTVDWLKFFWEGIMNLAIKYPLNIETEVDVYVDTPPRTRVTVVGWGIFDQLDVYSGGNWIFTPTVEFALIVMLVVAIVATLIV